VVFLQTSAGCVTNIDIVFCNDFLAVDASVLLQTQESASKDDGVFPQTQEAASLSVGSAPTKVSARSERKAAPSNLKTAPGSLEERAPSSLKAASLQAAANSEQPTILDGQVDSENADFFSFGDSQLKERAHEKENHRIGGMRDSRVDGQTRVRSHKKLLSLNKKRGFPPTKGKQQQILPGQFDTPPPASLQAALEDATRVEQQNARVHASCVVVAADFAVHPDEVSRCVDIAGCCVYASENNMEIVDVIRQAYTDYKQQAAGEAMDSDLGGMIEDVANELKKDIANYPAFD